MNGQSDTDDVHTTESKDPLLERQWRPLDLFLPTSSIAVDSGDTCDKMDVAVAATETLIEPNDRDLKDPDELLKDSESIDDREDSAANSQDESMTEFPVSGANKMDYLRSKFVAIFDRFYPAKTDHHPSNYSCDCLMAVDMTNSPLDQLNLLTGSVCGALIERSTSVFRCLQPLTRQQYYVRTSLSNGALTSLCSSHQRQLQLHLVCPVCGIFIEKGAAAVCLGKEKDVSPSDRTVHLFHRTCVTSEIKPSNVQCPHCGIKTGNVFPVVVHPIGEQPSLSTGEEFVAPAIPSETVLPQRMSFQLKGTKKSLTSAHLWRPADIARMNDVIAALELNGPLNVQHDGNSLVGFVAADDLISVASLLITHYATTDNKESTAAELQEGLITAVRKNRLLCLHMFCCSGVPVKQTDDGQAPIVLAILDGHMDIVRYLSTVCKQSLNVLNCSAKSILTALLDEKRFDTISLLLTEGLASPAMVNILCSGINSVPLDLRVYAEQFLPKSSTAWNDFEEALVKHSDMEKACSILLSDTSEILKEPFENIQKLCSNFPTLLDLMKGHYYEHDEPELIPDISYGKEIQPIPVHGRSQWKLKFPQFTYIRRCVFPDDVRPTRSLEESIQCSCSEKCNPLLCECRREGTRFYDKNGLLTASSSRSEYSDLYECNEFCLCGPDCGNRVVQMGVHCSFRVQKSTPGRGWGLFAASFIPSGSFLAEYVGEIILDKEADKRKQEYMYLFELNRGDGKAGQGYCIDASRKGNISRFLNHSCDPNADSVVVYYHTQDFRFPSIGMFAIKDIPAGQEICFNYGAGFWRIHSADYTCQCEAYSCCHREKYLDPTAARLLSPSRQGQGSTNAAPKSAFPDTSYGRRDRGRTKAT